MSSQASRIVLDVEDIDRKYDVQEKIAEGGMGEIYKARHLLLDEIRVIKTVRPQLKDDPELRERFLREARLATQLHHPNIARIHDLSVGEDGTACIVMEFVHGINLAERMQRTPKLDQEEVLELAIQTLDALAYLHQRKIVHRDISPDNIMLARDADGSTQVKLIDLGIAKPLESAGFQTQTAMFIGKVRYASPEQLGGGQGQQRQQGQPLMIDGRSDIYSLGVVLYELLTGAYPIQGTDEASLLAGHLFHPPRDFAEVDPDGEIPEPIRQALRRSLEKDREQRFQSADEFSRALRGVGEDTTGDARAAVFSGTPPVSADDPTIVASDPAAVPAATAATDATPVDGSGSDQKSRLQLPLPLIVALAALIVVAGGYLIWALAGDSSATKDGAEEDLLAGIDFGTYKALVIGNDDYAYLPDLETATRDARDVAQVLEDRYDFHVTLLLNADRSRLVNALYDFTGQATPTDNLLVYYAGHGSLTGPGGGGAWLPVDAQPMEDTNWVHTSYDVTMALQQSQARHILVVADSCYSSALGVNPLRPAAEEDQILQPSREEVLAALQKPSRLVLAAGELKPVPDSGGEGHSVFSGALIEVLGANDGLLPVRSLYAEVAPRVREASERLGVLQRPQFGAIDGAVDKEQDFYFRPQQDQQITSFSGTSLLPPRQADALADLTAFANVR